MTVRVGIYVRISHADAKEDTPSDPRRVDTAVERQLHDCQAYAAAQGWEVVDVFEDRGISAWQRRTRRPEFERLVRALQTGMIDVALAWKFDRLNRTLRDFARLKDAADDGGGYVMDMHGVETRTPAGRQSAGILASIAEAESENTSIRLKRLARARALKGLLSGGGTRALGYAPGYRTVIPHEAALVREAADRILAGETLHGICTDWERRGVRSVTGKGIATNSIRRVLMSPTFSGQREVDGRLLPGNWPAILTPEQTARLRAVLGDPERLRRSPLPRKYLLTGLLRCGRDGCGAGLVGRPRSDGATRYVCPSAPGLPGCGKLTRLAEPIEELVTFRVLERMAATTLPERDRDADQVKLAMDELSKYEAALSELANDFYVEKAISRPEYFRAREGLQAKIHQLRSPMRKRDHSRLLAPLLTTRHKRRVWDSKDVAWRRSVLAALIDEIVVRPAIHGRRTFDPTKIEIRWRT